MTRGNPRIHTNLTGKQLADLTRWCIRHDRSTSYAVSQAVTRFLSDVEPYEGEADYKVMSRTSEANATALKAYKGKSWRYVNACVQRLLDDDA